MNPIIKLIAAVITGLIVATITVAAALVIAGSGHASAQSFITASHHSGHHK